MLERVLEPEVMDTWEDAVDYDAMDFNEVNNAFVQRQIELGPPSGVLLDLGIGTARIPILIVQQNPNLNIIGIDLSKNMLKIGEANIIEANLTGAIELRSLDAKNLPFADNYFDMVISNSLLHHLPDPLPCLKEIYRIIKPNGGILIRDLIRPHYTIDLEALMKKYATDCTDRQQKLFRDSLLASYSIDEVQTLLAESGIQGAVVTQSSDRHWSIERRWYKELKKDFPLSKSSSDTKN